jgi:uridine kinase
MADMLCASESILREIEALRQKKQPLIIGIDGRSAAGKTALATNLQKALSCNLLHMDHFFLRPEQRTAERMSEPGGNVDYERFLEEVLLPLIHGRDFSYRPFDCQRQDFGDSICVQANAVNIVEGSYSCHPKLRGCYNLRIFLSVDPEEQLLRIRQRNGDARAAVLKDKWIPLEEHDFSSCHIREHSDLQY